MAVKAGYKQTEVGVIPEDWDVCSLKTLLHDLLQGINTAIDKPEYVVSGIPMLKANNIIDQVVVFDGADHVSENTYARYSERYRLKKNDFLFSNIGARLGTGSLLEVDLPCTFAWNVMRMIPNTKLVYPKYFSSIINSPKISLTIKNTQSGSGMGFVPKGVIEKISIPLPPTLTEQTAIATALSDADALIEALEQLIEKKRNIKQGAMQELLTGKKRLPGFSGEWEVVKLGSLLTMTATYGIVTAGNFTSTGILMLRSGDIKGGRIGSDMPFVSEEKSTEYSRTILKKNDVVIALVGYPGEAAKVPSSLEGANISRAVGLLRLNGKVSPDYLVSYLNSPIGRRMVLAPSAGSAQQVVNLAALNKLSFDLPCLQEQTAIATILSDMDSEIAALEEKLNKARHVKQGMMQELLTGRVRLV